MRDGLTSQRLRHLGIGAWSLLGGALLLAALVWLMVQVSVVLLPLALAVGIVYVLNPAVTGLHQRGVHRLVGTALCYVVTAGLLTLAAGSCWRRCCANRASSSPKPYPRS